ncbi:unnamed protein product, partial [Didymodactylos carnosus]
RTYRCSNDNKRIVYGYSCYDCDGYYIGQTAKDFDGIKWGNNCNELNAAYAADGYARIKGVGALLTTFGVGELSAINGVAGSFSEMVPVVHIVGTPATASQAKGALLHHTLGNGDFRVFAKMYKEVTIAQADLNKHNAAEEIDRVLKKCVISVRPVYISLPVDLNTFELNIDSDQIKPLDLKIPLNPPEEHEAAITAILNVTEKAESIVVVVDACTLRHQVQKEVLKFVEHAQLPVYVTPMGKGGIDEHHPQFRGVYAGDCSYEQVAEEIHNADIIISVGSLNCDFNTGGFTFHLKQKKTIELHSFATKVFYAVYDKVNMKQLLPDLTKRWPTERIKKYSMKPIVPPAAPPSDNNQEILHDYFWKKVPDFMPENSIIVAETGTSEFGIFNLKAPNGSVFLTQILWGSIGYSVGACLGAATGSKKEKRRVFLFVGDGSFQVVCQEVSSMLRSNVTPVIILLNNDGYTIEKLIHGPDRAYNSIQMWNYHKTFEYFGAGIKQNTEQASIGYTGQVSTRKDFEKVMEQVRKEDDKIHFIEVIMPKLDAPTSLIQTIEGVNKNKKLQLNEE